MAVVKVPGQQVDGAAEGVEGIEIALGGQCASTYPPRGVLVLM
jgi:hypothetical protein